MPPMPPETKAMRDTAGMDSSRQDSRDTTGATAWLPIFSFLALNGEGDAHTPADAERRQATLRVALLHFVQQRDENAAARGADRVPERDGASVHIHLAGVPAHLPVHGDSLCGKGLVDLHQVEVLRLPPCARQTALGSRHRSHPHV